MSFIGSLFSDSKGAGFQAAGPSAEGLTGNLNQANQQLQGTIGANATDAANLAGGTSNLNNSYAQSQALAAQLAAQNGIGNQSQVYNQTQNLAQNGSSLAGSQLTAATNQGIQQAAGTVASTKGLNPALAARLAGQQAGASGQTAANQAAQLQAQVQMNALGQAGGLATSQVNQQAQNLGQSSGIAAQQVAGRQASLGANAGIQQGNANLAAGALQGQNTVNAGIAAGNQKAQAGLVGGILNAAGSALPMLAEGGMIKPHYAEGTPAGGVQPTAAPAIQKPKTSAISSILKGMSATPESVTPPDPMFDGMSNFASGVGKAVGGLFKKPNQDPVNVSQTSGADMLASGGADPYMVEGTKNAYALQNNLDANTGRPMMAGGGMFNLTGDDTQKSSGPNPMMAALLAKGGKVPAMVSPGEIYLKPQEAREVAKGKKSPMSGEKIPGKASVKGNSLKNDTVPKTLETGGVVIPRSVLEGPKAHQNAYKFVNAVLAKSAMKPKGKK